MKILLTASFMILSASVLAQTSANSDQASMTYGTPDAKFMEQVKPLTQQSSLVICAGQPIPQGWVVIARTTDFQCSSSIDNAYVIKIPGATETICAFSPMPANYVITATVTNFQCSSNLNNARVIRRI